MKLRLLNSKQQLIKVTIQKPWKDILDSLRYNTQMEINMRDILKMVLEMDKEKLYIKTVTFLTEFSQKENLMVQEKLPIKKEVILKANLKMAKRMVMDL